jgi:hypothetical protein
MITQTTVVAFAATTTPANIDQAGPEHAASLAELLVSGDPAVALLGLMLNGRGVQSAVAREDVERQSKLIDELRARIAEELHKADEAQQHSGFLGKLSHFFSGDLGAILGVVAALAATVATGGASAMAIVALVGASASATAKVGAELGLDPKVCELLSAAGALCGLAAGNVGGATGLVSTASEVANAGAQAAGVGTQVASKLYEAKALDAQAEAKRGEGLQDQASARIDVAIEILQNAVRDLARATETVSGIEANADAGRSAIIARLGAA